MKTYGGAKVYILTFLTSNLHGGEKSILRPRHLTSDEVALVPRVVGWVVSAANGRVFRNLRSGRSVDNDYEKCVFWYDFM